MNRTVGIRDCFKNHRHDQDKVRSPQETIQWVRDRLTHCKMDVLAKTQRIDTGRLDIPVYISLCGPDATRFTGTKKQMGKGASPVQSEASAMMELMERFSFFSFIHQTPFPLKTYDEVAQEAVSVAALLDSLHDTTTPPELCEAFLRQCPLRWVKGRNLTQNRDEWIPIDWFFLINEYNGPASGNTLEEAILQSLCEVVERHVGSIISHEKLSTPTIDLTSVKDPVALELIRKFQDNGIELFARDFSLNTGIPTVGTLAYDPATFPEKSEIVFTAGTTPNPEKSLCRALTEIAQLAGDFESRTSYKPTLPKYRAIEEARYLMENHHQVSIDSLPNLDHDNMRLEIERCVQALQKAGMEVLVLDVTHGELEIPAVYTVIPGAHFLDRTRETDFAQHAARTLLRGTPPEQAFPFLSKLLDSFGPRYDLTFFMAHGLERQGQPQEALQLFEQALTQNPERREVASIYVHMASCRKDLERFEEALEALNEAEKHNVELKEIFNLKGYCLYRLKRHDEAIVAFERAIELDPGSAIDYANIGSNLRELGHYAEAIRLYRMALDLDPDIQFARDNLRKLEEMVRRPA